MIILDQVSAEFFDIFTGDVTGEILENFLRALSAVPSRAGATLTIIEHVYSILKVRP